MHSEHKITISHEITSIEDAPSWMIDNRYLFSGYRKNFNCMKSSIKSLFLKHNETMNVWTHLLGAILFFACMAFLILSFENSRLLYSQVKNNLSYTHLSDLLKERSNKVIKAFEEVDLNYNFQTFKNNIERIRKIQTKFFQETKTKIIQSELEIIKTFNSQIDKLSRQADSYIDNCLEFYKNVKSNSSFNIKEALSKFENIVSGQRIVEIFDKILNIELEVYPLVLFFISAIACFGFSSVFHLFYVINPTICKILQKLDYAGISILIFGSSYNLLYYYFYCNSFLFYIYSTAVGSACLTVFFVSLSNFIDKPEYTRFKGLMYGVLGISSVTPILHMIYINWRYGYNHENIPLHNTLVSLLFEAMFYLGGLAIYISRFPEKYYPKTFDIWLNSHVIWHICVIGGATFHLWAIITMYNLRNEHHCY